MEAAWGREYRREPRLHKLIGYPKLAGGRDKLMDNAAFATGCENAVQEAQGRSTGK
jgi:hypothetical protein